MLRTRHKSWFGVATADMFITSEQQPLGFGGCSQWAWIDCRNRRCRSGRHEEYQAFEADVVADYDARTAVERELVPRFASLLWRMRRATAIETDLLQIQAEILSDRQYERDCRRHRAETRRASPIAFSSEQDNAEPRDTGSSHVDQSESTDDRGDSVGLHRVDPGGISSAPRRRSV